MTMHVHALVAVLAASVAALPGCGDQCQAGEATCDGAQIRTCDTSDDLYADWRGIGPDCGSAACIELTIDGLREATCSTTGQPDPQCAGDSGASFCDAAGEEVSCAFGYSTIDDCASAGEACVPGPYGDSYCSQAM